MYCSNLLGVIDFIVYKMNKILCRNNAFDIRTFNSERLEKQAEDYFNVVNCSFESETFPECEKTAFVWGMLKKTMIEMF